MANNRLCLISIVDPADFGDNLPDIFEMQSIVMDKTIYTGTYPTIKHNTDSIIDRGDHKGAGIGGLCINTDWYIVERKDQINDALNLKL